MTSKAPDWLQSLLAAPEITDICVNGAEGKVFVDRGKGFLEPVDGCRWGPEGLKTWVIERLSEAGKSWDARHPFADAPLGGTHRLHAAFPPASPGGVLLSLRRLATRPESTLEAARASAIQRWHASEEAYALLAEAVKRGESVILSGATGSGKTTLAGDLLCEVSPSERLIALEDTPELAPIHPHFVTLLSRPANADGFGEISLRTLLRQVLRMRPDRVILGECRGGEVLDLLQALNTGHRGAMATLHAHSPRDALRRIELLCLLSAGGSIPVPVIRELVASGIQWVAQVGRIGSLRKITEIARVEGREGDTILLRPLLKSPSLGESRNESRDPALDLRRARDAAFFSGILAAPPH